MERKRKTEIAPVRRTLVATWSGVGSSVVAKIGVENGSSMGPSSAAVSGSVGAKLVAGSSAWEANHGSAAP